MSGFRGKRKEEVEYASEGDTEGHAPPRKKTSKKDSSDDSTDDIVVCEISKNRRVTVRSWQGKVVVDIREFYVKDGKQLPGKKVNSANLNSILTSLVNSAMFTSYNIFTTIGFDQQDTG